MKSTIIIFLTLVLFSCRKLDEDGTPRDIRVTWNDTCIYKAPMSPHSECKSPGQEFYVTVAKGQTFNLDLWSKNTCVQFPREFEVTVRNEGKVIYRQINKEHKVSIKIE